jgi:hypothetical protein
MVPTKRDENGITVTVANTPMAGLVDIGVRP